MSSVITRKMWLQSLEKTRSLSNNECGITVLIYHFIIWAEASAGQFFHPTFTDEVCK